MAMPNVLFSRGSSVNFPSVVKDPNTLYFLTDTHEMYLGGEKYAFGDDISVVITGVGDTVTDVTYSAADKLLTLVKGDAGDAASVKEAIQEALDQCVKTISSDRGSSILVDSEDPNNIKLSLNIAEGQHAGNVEIEECSDGLRANVEIPEATVTGIVEGEKVLSLDGTNLQTTLSVAAEKDSEDRTFIVLKGKGGVEISKFDASDFVKAGMLKSVALEDAVVSGEIHRILVLEFNIEGGRTETIRVDLQEFIDIYSAKAGGGLKLEGSEFSIDNNVEASDGVIADTTVEFGQDIQLKTVKYNDKGLIVGTKTVTFRIPGLSGSAGTEGSLTKLLTFVGVNNTGTMSGETIDISTAISASSGDDQIPTAKAVWQAIDDAKVIWERF